MCSRPLVLAALLLAGAVPVRAQRSRDPDPAGWALLMRAESLTAAADSAGKVRQAENAVTRHGQVVRAGRLVLVYWESMTPEKVQSLAVRADSVLEAFGGALAESLDSVVGVATGVSDTARVLALPTLRHRRPVLIDVPRADDSLQAAFDVATRIARAHAWRLDATWRNWIRQTYGVVWQPRFYGEWALLALTQPQWSAGAQCLAGRLADCRLWLALDPAERPFATRYRAADLRSAVQHLGLAPGALAQLRDDCVTADDAACLRFVERNRTLDEMPAPEVAREGFIRAVWTRHGPGAISRAFRDTVGGVGDRLARAAGVSEDSLVAEWRMWVLSRGRTEPLAASVPQGLIVLLAALVVVFFATRSGRWR